MYTPIFDALIDANEIAKTWGFEEIGGERRYARHLDFTGPKGEHLQKKLIYDYSTL